MTEDLLAVARARRERGEPVTVIATHLRVGRSTLYRALDLEHGAAAWQAAGEVPVTAAGKFRVEVMTERGWMRRGIMPWPWLRLADPPGWTLR